VAQNVFTSSFTYKHCVFDEQTNNQGFDAEVKIENAASTPCIDKIILFKNTVLISINPTAFLFIKLEYLYHRRIRYRLAT
jgi:hypothetical protein